MWSPGYTPGGMPWIVVYGWFLAFVLLALFGAYRVARAFVRPGASRFLSCLGFGLLCLTIGLIGCWSVGIGTLMIAGAVGAYLAFSGAPRRSGRTPYCRRCRYNLTGIESARCPECGAHLDKRRALLIGERRWRPGWLTVGVVLLLLALSPLAREQLNALRNIRWYGLKPTAWVFADARSSTASVALQALHELSLRASAGKLEDPHKERLVEMCLAHQARDKVDAARGPAAIDILSVMYERGELCPEHADQFFETMFRFEVATRPRAVKGRDLPVAISCDFRTPGYESGRTFLPSARLQFALAVAGEVVQTFGDHGVAPRQWYRNAEPLHQFIVIRRAGTFDLTCTATIDIADRTIVRRATAPVEVLPEEPPDYITLRRSEELDTAVLDAISVSPLTMQYDYAGASLCASVRVYEAPPIDLAFEVIGNRAGYRLDFGEVAIRSEDAPSSYRISVPMFKAPDQPVTITLKASEQAARHTVDIEEIWGGSLLFESVPVDAPGEVSGRLVAPGESIRADDPHP